jgi:hypothetical protein
MHVHARPIFRSLYLGTLALLQLALLTQIAPPLARTLKAHALFASLHDGWPVFAHLAGLALAVIGGALALQFPLLALHRHWKRGRIRFAGLPRWAILVATAGAALFVAALAAVPMLALLPLSTRGGLAPVAQSIAIAGTAMMAAGALWAELLRRSVAPVPVPAWQCTTARVEPLMPAADTARAA